ncbi:flagellar basal-body rod protein FlgF [Paludibacterium paludis]|uniref:Flagellar basal-body rod protein FlgF n=1 Tax=Paludibacterium paludis TaxID=1225769 RepID=A0A918UC48_9NEIS|nr:flagellar basal-body rod protein FlgF [Paludibacterium paludis]GGY28890.1 flagellar hook protein FlgE [Paludibacterium paludis]
MIDTIYTALSGMQSFQKGLSNISGNIANLNTPGYKRTELQFTDLMYRYDSPGRDGEFKGTGVGTGSTISNFHQGELGSSPNPLDIAIDGEGFFICAQPGQTVYTRAGQFELDAEGNLVNRNDKSKVQGLASDGKIRNFSVRSLRSQAAKPTKTVTFTDNLSTGSQSHKVDATVYDSEGQERRLKFSFVSNTASTPGSWKVEASDGASGSVVGSGEIRFGPDGTLQAGYNQFTLYLRTSKGGASPILLDFGTPGSLSSVTSLSWGSTSTLSVAKQDGYVSGSMTKLAFDKDGVATISYSNGQETKGDRLALAWFSLPNTQLQRVGGGAYKAVDEGVRQLGRANQGVFGKIAGGSLELSNVELSDEFSQMITTQRGYQAASQLISAANEMMQQALGMKASR